jgi:hypothetical protein
MAIFQCLFYKQGRIDYWENIEAISDVTIRQLLLDRLSDGDWEFAEAFLDGRLVCRVGLAP